MIMIKTIKCELYAIRRSKNLHSPAHLVPTITYIWYHGHILLQTRERGHRKVAQSIQAAHL